MVEKHTFGVPITPFSTRRYVIAYCPVQKPQRHIARHVTFFEVCIV